MIKKIFRVTGLKVGLLITLASLFIYAFGIPFLQLIELKAYDLHFVSGNNRAPGPEVVIVAVDEKSLDELGRWPWPRTVFADLVNKLGEYQASVIAFDVIFSEPDNSSGLKAIRELKKSISQSDKVALRKLKKMEFAADNDRRLADAVENNPAVVLGYFFFMSDEELLHLDDYDKPTDYIMASNFAFTRSIDGSDTEPNIIRAVAYEDNIEMLSKAATGFGSFNVVPDRDGTIRRAPLVFKYKDALFPHLSLEVVRKYAGNPPLMLNVAEYGVDSIMVGDIPITTDERGKVLINYRGPERTFPHYSIVDVIKGNVPAKALQNKIVLIGATATGIYDLRVTPVGATFPGIEVHANIIDNILGGDFIKRPDWVGLLDIAVIIFLGVVLSILIPRVRAVFTILSAIFFSVLFIFLNGLVFNSMNIWISFIYPLITIFTVSAGVTVFQYMTEEKKKREIRDAFSRYVAPSLVQRLVDKPDMLILGGEEKRLTVFFSDIRGFTTISEGLKPHTLVSLMNDYLTPMTDIVFKHKGTVDKYMGDAIMAFWGAPIDDDDHALNACKTALEMMRTLPTLQPVWDKYGIKSFKIGIGMSTGVITVGNMGSEARFDYTVIGDAINLGSRLEGLTKQYRTDIIVPKYTYEDVRDKMLLRELDMVQVKGKEQWITIYELMGEINSDKVMHDLKRTFEEGLECYRAQKWDEASLIFKRCLGIVPGDGPSSVFLERIAELRTEDLGLDWNGIYVMKSK